MEQTPYHVPVMVKEVVDGLCIRSNGTYVDCTFGGGGHSKAILEKLDRSGRLVVFDQDPDAKVNAPNDDRLLFLPHNFRHLSRFMRLHGIEQIDGLLADLGISSFQIDQPSRGFSLRFEGPLDMRMDSRQELTAKTILETYSEQKLHSIFEKYGEVTNAKTLARTIVGFRQHHSLQTITQLREAIHGIVKGNPNKYFAQVFQALRMEVNDELGALNELLIQIPPLLKPGGRVAIITFHSLEDRIVKRFFKMGTAEEEEVVSPFHSASTHSPFRVITKKPVVPNADEQRSNPRSRSAKLRIAEKI
jgi:16S rRNA (cytosine1402-N4)-methyltransferase